MGKSLFWEDEFKQRDWKSEAEFQATCTKWFDKTFPDKRGQLMLLYQNPPNAIIGAKMISMGLRYGSSDQLYIYDVGRIAWIEYKIKYNTQDNNQEAFQNLVERLGFEYYLVKNDIEIFKQLIYKLHNSLKTN